MVYVNKSVELMWCANIDIVIIHIKINTYQQIGTLEKKSWFWRWESWGYLSKSERCSWKCSSWTTRSWRKPLWRSCKSCCCSSSSFRSHKGSTRCCSSHHAESTSTSIAWTDDFRAQAGSCSRRADRNKENAQNVMLKYMKYNFDSQC